MAENALHDPATILPPRTEAERLAWLRLIRSRRVGVTTFFRLMREHGSADAALDALPAVARAAGVERYAPCPESAARAELETARSLGARMLCFGEAEYPDALAEIPDPPPILWARGDTDLLKRRMVALVGARNASSLGTRMARRLAAELSEAGHTVVSGLARGVDAAAHHAALEHGTAAVMAGGIDVVYPAENTALADELFRRGVALSEQPPGMQPLARHFPVRNRVISGLSQAVVVVEAALKSGSLITARNALDQGREVLAVPGHPIDARASGCNALIRDGAVLVRNGQDVMDALARPRAEPAPAGPPAPRPHPPRRPLADVAALHGEILSRLGPTPIATDQLIRDLDLPARTVNPELTALELEGRIELAPGGLVTRRSG